MTGAGFCSRWGESRGRSIARSTTPTHECVLVAKLAVEVVGCREHVSEKRK